MRCGRKGFWRPALLAAVLGALAAFPCIGAEPASHWFESWTPKIGQWRAHGELYRQTTTAANCLAFALPADWGDYTYEVKARKTGGAEGFLILFRAEDEDHFFWWNIGGWGNKQHALETRPKKRVFSPKPGSIETGKWYDVKIVLRGSSIRCYLDGQLIHDVDDPTYKAGGIGLGSWRTSVEYKDVLVTAPDGKKLYGPDRAELVDRALSRIGTAGVQRELSVRRCPPVVFIKRQAGGRRGTNATMLARMTGAGSAICVYDPARPQDGARTIVDDSHGFIFDMSPSFDATKLLFAYKKNVAEREDSFHVYEINVDGTGLRQLTTGRYHDVSPVYLPDGRIVFNSTRVEAFSVCQNFLAAALYVIDGDGGNLRRLEYNTLCDTTPSVLDDGSILFTRWEYQDKNIFCTEGLWTLNPDGTRLQLYYGNTLTVPNAIYGAKQIPGTKKVLAVMAAHHYPPLGGIAIIDRRFGLESTEAMTVLTPEVPYRPTKGNDWRETNWGPGDVFYPWSFTDPWPVEKDLFLVSYGGPLEGGPQRYRLYLIDDTGFKVPLYEDPKTSCYNPVPLRPRPMPRSLPGQVPPEPKGQGRYFVQDVYRGLLGAGVERGQVREIRVMSQIPKKYNTEGPRYSDHYPAIGEGSYYVKQNFGTVPVDDDGSAYFMAPAGVELYFQALDAGGKEIRRMGTVTQITDGEMQSCIGCHEHRAMAPPPNASAAARLKRPPDRITPPPWGDGPVDFVQQVQPVLDRYCVECHAGPAPEGDVDLSGDKTRLFNMAFETLVFTPELVARYHINPGPTGNFPPLASGSYVSRLTKLIEEEHEGVAVDDESRRKIFTWIDANVPYYGTWEMTRPHTFGGRDTWLDAAQKPLPWFKTFQAAYQAAGIPNPIDKLAHTDLNLTHPDESRLLLRHLAKSSGGRADAAKALFPTPNDPRYQALLQAIEQGRKALLAQPRMDMAGATPIPQQRDFGRTY